MVSNLIILSVTSLYVVVAIFRVQSMSIVFPLPSFTMVILIYRSVTVLSKVSIQLGSCRRP